MHPAVTGSFLLLEIYTCTGEFVGCPATSHEPLAPIDGLPVVDGFAGIQQDVPQLVEIRWIAAGVPTNSQTDVGRRSTCPSALAGRVTCCWKPY